MPINRLVALLTPVFSAAAAIGTAYVRKHCPSLPVPSTGELTVLEITAATAAGAAALKWLHGHQKWEERVSEAERDLRLFGASAQKVDPTYTREIVSKVARALKGTSVTKMDTASIVSDAEEFANQPPPAPPATPAQPTPAATPLQPPASQSQQGV